MIKLKEVEAPKPEEGLIPVMLSDETMQNRKARLLENMQKDGFAATGQHIQLLNQSRTSACFQADVQIGTPSCSERV